MQTQPIKPVPGAVLDVVTCISNPWRYKSRYHLYRQFEQYILSHPNVRLHTVELCYGDRAPEIAHADPRTNYIVLKCNHTLWHKENLLNIAIQNLPTDSQYVCVMDADVQFLRPDWVYEIIHLHQMFDVLQPWTTAYDLDHKYEIYKSHGGIIKAYCDGKIDVNDYKYSSYVSHPGFIWSFRKDALDKLGGLIDISILGSADRNMALGLLGVIEKSYHQGIHPNYRMLLHNWQDNALECIKKNVGYMDSGIVHHWHGFKSKRFYQERWSILTSNQYDPIKDIKKNSDGVWQLTDRNIKLRDDLRNYFTSREEDDIDRSLKSL